MYMYMCVHPPSAPSSPLSPLLLQLPSLPLCLHTDIAACSVVSVATAPLDLQVLLLSPPLHPLQRIFLSPLTSKRRNLSPAEMCSLKMHSQSVNLVIAGSSLANAVQRKCTKHMVGLLRMTFCLFHQVGKSLWVSLL